MSVIALRHGILAADTGFATATVRSGCMTKIARGMGVAGGAVGPAALIHSFLDWISSEAQDERPQFDADGFCGLLIRDQAVRIYARHGWFTPYRQDFYAIGAGAGEALAAMWCDAPAERAVWAAIKVVPVCGGNVETIDVRDLLGDAPAGLVAA